MEKVSKRFNAYRIRKIMLPVLFLLPGVVFTLILKYYTIGSAIQLSFFRYNIQDPPGRFVGLQNFANLFKDSDYWQSWRNTLAYLVLSLAITFFIPIIQALFLEEIIRLRSLASTIYILPAVIPGTVNIVLWKWIWNPSYGAANYLLKLFGGTPQTWMSDTHWVKFCIIFPGIIGGGIGVLMYLAAIYGISEDIKEAAQLDGCTGFKRMIYITLPNIKFLIFINFVMSTIGAMQILDSVFQYTNGGPALASESMPLYIYHNYMVKFNYGMGSAASLTLMLVIALLTLFQLKLNEKQD